MMEQVQTRRGPPPVHEDEETEPAPGDLELVRSLLSLHDHESGNPRSLPPSLESVRWWLTSRGLVEASDTVREQDLAWTLRIRDALIAKVRENLGEPPDPKATGVLNRAAEQAGLQVCFGCGEPSPIHVRADGLRGAIGRILGAAFLAELDGGWEHFRICHNPDCGEVFFDRSKNMSRKWCSMSSCGNRAKVRAFRERQAVE